MLLRKGRNESIADRCLDRGISYGFAVGGFLLTVTSVIFLHVFLNEKQPENSPQVPLSIFGLCTGGVVMGLGLWLIYRTGKPSFEEKVLAQRRQIGALDGYRDSDADSVSQTLYPYL